MKEKDIEAIQQCFINYPIESVVIFGSRAKGTYRAGSDIDLAIVDTGLTFGQLSQLENDLDDLLLPYKIDLLVTGEIKNEELKDHINRVGKSFYTKHEKSVK